MLIRKKEKTTKTKNEIEDIKKRRMGCNNSTSESEVKWQYTARSELRGTAEAKGTVSSTTTIK